MNNKSKSERESLLERERESVCVCVGVCYLYPVKMVRDSREQVALQRWRKKTKKRTGGEKKQCKDRGRIANVPVSGWEVFDMILANPKSHNLSVCVRTLISRFSGLMSLKGSKIFKFSLCL
jgi:hypothetical protein